MSWLLPMLWGMLFGYLIAVVELALIIMKKGYSSLEDIDDKHADS